jgi:CRISPR-associated endonuclease/helicase Cas3
MITEAAPLDSLVQRFGRINRKRTERTIGNTKPIHILSPKEKTLPYQKVIVEKSYDILPENGQVFHENSLQEKMNKVYQSMESKPIDIHLKFKDGEVQLKKLTDNPRSILIEALEIDGATCILECDRDKYIEANWMERVALEIPISFRTLRYYNKQYEQLKDIGSNPFVVPQDEEDYKRYGLTLVEPDNFL